MKTKPFEELVKEFPEVALYLTIEQLGYLQWRIRHDSFRNSSRGLINASQIAADDKAIEEVTKNLEIAVAQCERFGVPQAFIEKDKPQSGATDEYWKWYRWWDAYKKAMTDEEWKLLDDTLAKDGDISQFRPQGDWRT